MFIQTEATPNPATMKFLPGRTVLETGTADFTDATVAETQSPLAAKLFGVDGVEAVFLEMILEQKANLGAYLSL